MLKYLVYFSLCYLISAHPISRPVFVLKDAERFESPWFTLLTINGKYCGGSLVEGEYIITAAHCFEDIKYEDLEDKSVLQSFVKVRFGEWKTDTDPDCQFGVDGEYCANFVEIPVQKLIKHEKYKSEVGAMRYRNDIAIIKLNWPPRPSEAISSIELPSSDECEQSSEDQVWTVTGFGHIPGTKKYSTTKKKIDMKMISHEECESKLGSNKEFYDKKTHICGKGTKGETTCQGDSGSGITTTSDETSVLRGIVSFGVTDCGTTGVPTGFVKVACYSDWINSKIAEFQED